jgi:hypothetical protein
LSIFCVSPRFIAPIPTSACLRAATLGANWVYWPRGSDLGQAQRRSPSQATHVSHLDGSVTCSCIDTGYKEPRFTVPFDGRKEPRMISPMWPGVEPGTCRLLGGRDNY